MCCRKCHQPFHPSDDAVPLSLNNKEFQGERFLVHNHCFKEILADQKKESKKGKGDSFIYSLLRFLSEAVLLLVCLGFLGCQSLPAPKDTEQDFERGCLLTSFNGTTGTPMFIYFVKTGDKDTLSEDGEPEIWGYDPTDPPPKKNGYYHMRNYLKKRFVRAGYAMRVGHTTLHCPAW